MGLLTIFIAILG